MLKGKAIGDIVSFLKGANMYNASKLMENSGITPEEIRDAVKGRRTSPVSEKTLDYFFTYHNERCSSGFGDLFSDAKLAEPRPA